MAQRRYFVGDRLLGEIRETIDAVNGTPRGPSVTTLLPSPVTEKPSAQVIRIGTATGSWNKAATNTVSWNPGSGVTATSTATNLFANITGTTAAYSVAIARVANDWYLIAAECT
jgi:uncharacterized protein (DUF1501 family)